MSKYRITLEFEHEYEIEADGAEEAIEEAREYAYLSDDWQIRIEDITKKPEELEEQAEDTTDMVGLFGENER